MNYADIEARRKRIGGISRAAMCRRANVSESAVELGLKLNRKPIDVVRENLLGALDAIEAERLSRAQPQEGLPG